MSSALLYLINTSCIFSPYNPLPTSRATFSCSFLACAFLLDQKAFPSFQVTWAVAASHSVDDSEGMVTATVDVDNMALWRCSAREGWTSGRDRWWGESACQLAEDAGEYTERTHGLIDVNLLEIMDISDVCCRLEKVNAHREAWLLDTQW